MMAAKSDKKLNTSIFDNIQSPTQTNNMNVYINEHLCVPFPYKKLFYEAKDFANKNYIKFVWIRDGNIFMRKTEGSRNVTNPNPSDFLKIL